MEKVIDTLTPEGERFMKELRELAELEVRIGYQREQEPERIQMMISHELIL